MFGDHILNSHNFAHILKHYYYMEKFGADHYSLWGKCSTDHVKSMGKEKKSTQDLNV